MDSPAASIAHELQVAAIVPSPLLRMGSTTRRARGAAPACAFR